MSPTKTRPPRGACGVFHEPLSRAAVIHAREPPLVCAANIHGVRSLGESAARLVPQLFISFEDLGHFSSTGLLRTIRYSISTNTINNTSAAAMAKHKAISKVSTTRYRAKSPSWGKLLRPLLVIVICREIILIVLS